MERIFDSVVREQPPRLIDLPTGSGKTDLILIWLIALSWYGSNRECCGAIPRRLVWVVNRRVLVQQVFKIAREVQEKLHASDLRELCVGLSSLRGKEGELFRVVELRGQIVADREWAIRPSLPQLVIGTVDQIGSRLLFQGYGLGKWGRPQQAGLLGVDAWIAVDEAHLVPACVLTLRQLRERCAAPAESLPSPFNAIFTRLPFWLTELSATPGLPCPSPDPPFSLTEKEESDDAIRDRVLAANTRHVLVARLPKAEKSKDALVEKLVAEAIASNAPRTAIFVREVKVADRVTDGLRKAGIVSDHICKITGRIRGYERERLSEQPAFGAFLAGREIGDADVRGESRRYFLIGTAAAEVGLDADADVIFCDFAPLPTLLQRLGRLDRRGVLSRRHAHGKGDAPKMVIVASPEMTDAKVRAKFITLTAALKADTSPHSAELMSGAHWLTATKAKDEKAGDDEKQPESTKDVTAPLIEAATWSVLSPTDRGACRPSKEWLVHDNARIAAGPVIVPPVTDAVLDYWSATTEARSPHLSPHPFLYGLAEDDEGTPLVGVGFRLEVEALRGPANADDAEAADASTDVVEIFKRFPPLRAELHQMRLSALREWLASAEGVQHPLIYRARDKWHAKPAGESASAATAALGPNGTLILPASVLMRYPCKELLKDCEQPEGKNAAISDVLDGVSDSKQARYYRTIEPPDGLAGENGAWCWNSEARDQMPPKTARPEGFKQKLRKELRIAGTEYTFRYYRSHQDSEQWQYLDDQPGEVGHLTRARMESAQVAEA
ncbi:MAG TPA: type I-U CRISPR-associated helicase/endonuclease Cas3, partial [Chthoniobacteraceae bacterium]